jgi:hypothetical protein
MLIIDFGSYIEGIGERVSRGHWALGNPRSSIHFLGISLVQPMPMQAGGLVSESIVDFNNHLVSEINIKLGTWPLAVDSNHWPFEAIRSCPYPPNIPLIIDGLSESKLAEANDKKNEYNHDKKRMDNKSGKVGGLEDQKKSFDSLRIPTSLYTVKGFQTEHSKGLRLQLYPGHLGRHRS